MSTILNRVRMQVEQGELNIIDVALLCWRVEQLQAYCATLEEQVLAIHNMLTNAHGLERIPIPFPLHTDAEMDLPSIHHLS